MNYHLTPSIIGPIALFVMFFIGTIVLILSLTYIKKSIFAKIFETIKCEKNREKYDIFDVYEKKTTSNFVYMSKYELPPLEYVENGFYYDVDPKFSVEQCFKKNNNVKKCEL